MKKMLILFLCITFCVVLCATSVMGAGINTSLYDPNGGTVDPGISKIGNAIIGVLQVVGTIFAIAMLLFLGIRLMLASPSERADIKSRAVPYIVGAVMLFSIVNLLSIVYKIMQGI